MEQNFPAIKHGPVLSLSLSLSPSRRHAPSPAPSRPNSRSGGRSRPSAHFFPAPCSPLAGRTCRSAARLSPALPEALRDGGETPNLAVGRPSPPQPVSGFGKNLGRSAKRGRKWRNSCRVRGPREPQKAEPRLPPTWPGVRPGPRLALGRRSLRPAGVGGACRRAAARPGRSFSFLKGPRPAIDRPATPRPAAPACSLPTWAGPASQPAASHSPAPPGALRGGRPGRGGGGRARPLPACRPRALNHRPGICICE